MDIEANLVAYLGARDPRARHASFDYCFNHFQSYRQSPDLLASPGVLELSCLHLGFYLASWGMLRASTVLSKRSLRQYVPALELLATLDRGVWDIDAHRYSEDGIELLIDTGHRIRMAFPFATDTLITKIMLGALGVVPAFDTNFRAGFGVSTFDRKALRRISRFYEENAGAIDAHRVATLDFATGSATNVIYPRAKLIDMIFSIEGERLISLKKDKRSS